MSNWPGTEIVGSVGRLDLVTGLDELCPVRTLDRGYDDTIDGRDLPVPRHLHLLVEASDELRYDNVQVKSIYLPLRTYIHT